VTKTQTLSLRIDSRRLGILGLTSTSMILAAMLVTAVAYAGPAGEPYSPLNHFISELGEIAVSRLAWVFNLSLVAGGAGLGLFLVLLGRRLTARTRTAFLAFGAVAGVSGTLVGVFPMDYHVIHRVVADLFFMTGWIVAGTFSLWLVSARRAGFPRWLAAIGPVVGTISLAFIAVYSTYHPTNPDAAVIDRPDIWAVPVLEWASLLSLLAWFVCVSAVLLSEAD
jgi:hypothetical membrane protein